MLARGTILVNSELAGKMTLIRLQCEVARLSDEVRLRAAARSISKALTRLPPRTLPTSLQIVMDTWTKLLVGQKWAEEVLANGYGRIDGTREGEFHFSAASRY